MDQIMAAFGGGGGGGAGGGPSAILGNVAQNPDAMKAAMMMFGV
jgi:hypothetical protein